MKFILAVYIRITNFMPGRSYQNSRVFKIQPNDLIKSNDIKEYMSKIFFMGSTCKDTNTILTTLIRDYYKNANDGTESRNKYLKELHEMFDRNGTENYVIIPLETYPCDNKQELDVRVQYWKELHREGKQFERMQIDKVKYFTCACGKYVEKADRDYHMMTIEHQEGMKKTELQRKEERKKRLAENQKKQKEKLEKLVKKTKFEKTKDPGVYLDEAFDHMSKIILEECKNKDIKVGKVNIEKIENTIGKEIEKDVKKEKKKVDKDKKKIEKQKKKNEGKIE
jgi:hypothetical protein